MIGAEEVALADGLIALPGRISQRSIYLRSRHWRSSFVDAQLVQKRPNVVQKRKLGAALARWNAPRRAFDDLQTPQDTSKVD